MAKEVHYNSDHYYHLETEMLKALWRAVNSPKFRITIKGKEYAF